MNPCKKGLYGSPKKIKSFFLIIQLWIEYIMHTLYFRVKSNFLAENNEVDYLYYRFTYTLRSNMSTVASPSVPSSIQKTGWLPSFSLPKKAVISCWNVCQGAFQKLKNLIPSSAKPLAPRASVVSITTTHPRPVRKPICLRNHQSIIKTGIVFLGLCTLVAAESASKQISAVDQDVDQRISTVFTNAVIEKMKDYAPAILAQAGQKLLSSVTLSVLSATACSIIGTEGIPLSQTFKNWDLFKIASGRLVCSTNSPLPSGVQMSQAQFRILPAGAGLSVPNMGGVVASSSGKSFYLPSTVSGSVQAFNGDPNNPYIGTVLKTGFVVSSMVVSGNQLAITGPGVLYRAYDLTQELSPVYQGRQITNTTLTGNALAAAGGNQYGCLTNNGFYYIDGVNNEVVQSIPSISGDVIACDGDFYFLSNTTSLICLSTNPSTTPIDTLPILGVTSIFCANGYCYVGTGLPNKFYVVQYSQAGKMSVVSVLPRTNVFSMFQYKDLLYYTCLDFNGLGIMDISNRTNPTFPLSTTGLLPQVDTGATYAPLRDSLGIKTNTGFFFLPYQDSFTFSGTPAGGSQGTYPVSLQARTFDGSAVDTYNCSLTILPAITKPAPIQRLIAVINQLFSSTVLPTAFNNVRGAAMTYTLSCALGNRVTARINLSPTGQFSGIPRSDNAGSAFCTVDATDSFGSRATSDPFEILVTDSPALIDISTQLATLGVPFTLNLATAAQNSSSISISNLPSSFTFANNIISGTPTAQDFGTRSCSITVTDANGVSTTKTFTLNVVLPGIPAFVETIETQPATTASGFSFTIPDRLAFNENNPNVPIVYSASGLPSWLKFDGRTFTGTPAVKEKFFTDVTYTITVTATQVLPNGQQVSSSKDFNIILGGLAWGQLTLGFVGIAGIIYRQRKVGYNKFVIKYPWVTKVLNLIKCTCFFNNKEIKCYTLSCSPPKCAEKVVCVCSAPLGICQPITYKEETVVVPLGGAIDYTFKTPSSKIETLKVFFNGKEEQAHMGGALPSWLRTGDDPKKLQIFTVGPPPWNFESITVVAKTKELYYLELVTFKSSEPKMQRAESAGSERGGARGENYLTFPSAVAPAGAVVLAVSPVMAAASAREKTPSQAAIELDDAK
jgi:hypothetical protein